MQCRICESHSGEPLLVALSPLDLGDGEPGRIRRALCQLANEVRAGLIPPAVGTSVGNILRVVSLGETDEVWNLAREMRLERERRERAGHPRRKSS